MRLLQLLLVCCFVCVCAVPLTSSSSSARVSATVYVDRFGKFSFEEGVRDGKHGIAFGHFENSENATGWSYLEIETRREIPDELQMRAAGFLEGYLTAPLLSLVEHDSAAKWQMYGMSGPPQAVTDFLMQQREWVLSQDAKVDPLFHHYKLLFAQLDGLLLGYEAAGKVDKTLTPMNISSLLMIAAGGDIMDIISTVMPVFRADWEAMNSVDEVSRAVAKRSKMHCSALVVDLPDNDVFSAHNTWGPYDMMLRVFKRYTIPLKHSKVSAVSSSFSSYPGVLSSSDDFYVLSNGLHVLETSFSIFNNTLYQQLTPKSLLAWQRAMVANRVAENALEWTDIFSKYNSGTYNNQWIVIDSRKAKDKSADGYVVIAEQTVGYVAVHDVTNYVRQTGYWPSYNIPYDTKVYDICGYPAMKVKYGDEMSYEKCPRAQIFARDAAKVKTIEDMKFIMRYNDYQHDPLSLNDPRNSIASRYDLMQKDPMTMGAIDAKIARGSWGDDQVAIIAGPTTQGQTAFTWTKAFDSDPHSGQPLTFQFDWVQMQYEKK